MVRYRVLLTVLIGAFHAAFSLTAAGQLSIKLPLGLNDPPGTWKVCISELLANTEGCAQVEYAATASCGWLAGATHRAVFFGPDRHNVFRFARVHRSVSIVPGNGDYDAAARRLVEILKPWDVHCRVVAIDEASRSRVLTPDEAATWCGLNYAARGQIKPGDGNPPQCAGFAVRGPVILLGTPEDNPLIRLLAQEHFLPYEAGKDFPGPGRGYVAWQRDGIGPGQESLTLLAYDAEGMAEAIGSAYEAVAGLDPLTPLAMPTRSEIVAASKAQKSSHATIVWQTTVPDRVTGVVAKDGDFQVLSRDGSLTTLAPDGRPKSVVVLEGSAYAEAVDQMKPVQELAVLAKAQLQVGPTRRVKFVKELSDKTLLVYWGGTLELQEKSRQILVNNVFAQDISAICVCDNRILVGLADGRVLTLDSQRLTVAP